jgi:hypothetical protein
MKQQRESHRLKRATHAAILVDAQPRPQPHPLGQAHCSPQPHSLPQQQPRFTRSVFCCGVAAQPQLLAERSPQQLDFST